MRPGRRTLYISMNCVSLISHTDTFTPRNIVLLYPQDKYPVSRRYNIMSYHIGPRVNDGRAASTSII